MTKVKTLLLTRPEAQSRALVKDIETRFPDKTKCIVSPLMTITPMGHLPDISDFQALLFTSVNGVQTFTAMGGTTIVRCYCVGTRTAKAARDAVLNAISADGAAAELIALVAGDLTPAEGALLHIRGEQTAGDIAGNLSGHGFTVHEAVLYRQDTCDLNAEAVQALANGEVDGLPLYSPLSARRLAEVLTENTDWPKQNLSALCISENVAAEVRNLSPGRIEVAVEPNGTEMLALIGRFLR